MSYSIGKSCNRSTLLTQISDEIIVLSDLGNVLFAFDSAQLTSEAQALLADVSTRLTGASLISVRVVGHTDSVGSEAYNQELSERRARSVADFLVAQGVPAEKLSNEGRGESQPVADNASDAGRAQNRRVENRLPGADADDIEPGGFRLASTPMRHALLFSVFVIASCGLAYELIAGALSSYLLGDSVTQFSTVIGTYLFAMGAGSWLSKYITRDLIGRFIQIELFSPCFGL